MSGPKRSKRKPKGNYGVGYCRPPKAGQIKKGEVRNPRGRPKGMPSIKEILERELHRKITITENGGEKVITIAEALVKRWIAKALGNDNRSMENLLASVERYQAPSEHDEEPLSANDEQILKWLNDEFGGEGSK